MSSLQGTLQQSTITQSQCQSKSQGRRIDSRKCHLAVELTYPCLEIRSSAFSFISFIESYSGDFDRMGNGNYIANRKAQDDRYAASFRKIP